MNNKKMKKLFLLILLLGKINYSFSLSEREYIKVVGSYGKALECFRNPDRVDSDRRNDCSKVSSYMKKLRYGNNESLNSEDAKNIMLAIQADSWDIQTLDFQDCAIDSTIFNTSPPPQVKKIILSKNIALKETVISIPDKFLNNLSSCPFQKDDNIKVNNCSAKLKNICSSNISCINVSNNNKPVNPPNNVPSKNIPPNNIPPNNIPQPSATVNPVTIINGIVTTQTIINDTSKNNNKKNNSTVSDNGKIDQTSNVQKVDDPDTSDKSDSLKSLIKTFLFGLFTSFGILMCIILILCLLQRHSKTNIVGLKKLTEYYERKPLVKDEKSPSSSMNDTSSMNDYGSQSTHSNYAMSNSSQASYSTQNKHKRYLYVFDDGSVMMSKSLNSNNLILQSNVISSTNIGTSMTQNSCTAPLTHNSVPTLSSNIKNLGVRSSLNSTNVPTTLRNSKLSVSTTSNNNYVTHTSLSPISPADSLTRLINNRNTVSIPQQTHTNHLSSLTDKRSSGPYSAA